MAIEVTEEAAEVLKRSLELAGVDASSGGVRLRGTKALGGGFDVQVELAAEAAEGEQHVVCSGLNLFVDATVSETLPDAVVAVEPQHETVVVRPAGPV